MSDKIDWATYTLGVEKIVGTWIDGRTLYRRIYSVTGLSTENVVALLPGTVVMIDAWLKLQSGYIAPYGQYSTTADSSTSRVFCDQTYIKVQQGTGLQGSSNTAVVVVYYTKN